MDEGLCHVEYHMENIRNYKEMNLVTSQEKYVKYVMKQNFKDEYPLWKELLVKLTEGVYVFQTVYYSCAAVMKCGQLLIRSLVLKENTQFVRKR